MTKVSFAEQATSAGCANAASFAIENSPVVASQTKKTASVSRTIFAIILSFFSCFCFGSKKKAIPNGKATLAQDSEKEVKQVAEKVESVRGSKTLLRKKNEPNLVGFFYPKTKQTILYNLNVNVLKMQLSLFRKLPDDLLASATFQSVFLGGDHLTKITKEDIEKFRSLAGKKTLHFCGSRNLTKLPVEELLSLPKDLTIDLRDIGFGDPEEKAKKREKAFEIMQAARETGNEDAIKAARIILHSTLEKLDKSEKELDEALALIESTNSLQNNEGPRFLFSSIYDRKEQRKTYAQRAEDSKDRAVLVAYTDNYESSGSSS